MIVFNESQSVACADNGNIFSVILLVRLSIPLSAAKIKAWRTIT